MAAGSKEKELEDTLPGAEEAEVSAEASELRRRLLAVASNDSAVRQRSGTGTLPPAAEPPQSDGRALRATLQFVRRRPAGNEEVTVTAVSGAPLPARETSAPQAEVGGGDVEVRPSRARVVVPLVAGALLVLVALIHRTLSSNEPAQASSVAAPKAAGLLVPPPRSDVPAPRRAAPAASASAKVAASASPVTPPSPVADSPRSPGDEAARLLATVRSKAQRSNRAPAAREARSAEASAPPSSPEPVLNEAAPEPAPTTKPRARLVEDAPRPGLLD